MNFNDFVCIKYTLYRDTFNIGHTFKYTKINNIAMEIANIHDKLCCFAQKARTQQQQIKTKKHKI